MIITCDFFYLKNKKLGIPRIELGLSAHKTKVLTTIRYAHLITKCLSNIIFFKVDFF
jgi:hypothetical protein